MAICLYQGPNAVVTQANDRMCAIWGYQAEQVLGRPWLEAMPEMRDQGFIELMAEVARTRVPFVGQEAPAQLRRNGQLATHYFNFVYQALLDARGDLLGVLAIAVDVTEQVLARQQRAAAQAQLQAVFEQAPVAVIILQGPTYAVETVNSSMCALWDLLAAAAVGQPIFEVLPAAASHAFRGRLDEVRQTGAPYVAYELPAVLSREPAFFNVTYQPLDGPPGQPSVVMVLATDVSQQVAARQQLALANAELQAANQQLTRTNADLDNFIYAASHDLKAPITNIEGLLQALEEQLPPAVRQAEQVRPLLRMMEGAVERFQKPSATSPTFPSCNRPIPSPPSR
ncbi:MAG: PAS domain-containing protein [Hymenobacter sp.]